MPQPRKKPVSRKQLAANRRNAQRSTGPRTAAARQTVSRNAVRHGLNGKFSLLPEEDRAAHQSFCREIIGEFAPATALEFNLAQTIANDLWRIHRAAALENNIFAEGIDEDEIDEDDSGPGTDPALRIALAGARTFLDHAPRFALLSLYEQRLNRAVYKKQAELRQMQMERRQAGDRVGDQAGDRDRATLLRQLVKAQIQQQDEELQRIAPPAAEPYPRPANDLTAMTAPNGIVHANNVFAPPPSQNRPSDRPGTPGANTHQAAYTASSPAPERIFPYASVKSQLTTPPACSPCYTEKVLESIGVVCS